MEETIKLGAEPIVVIQSFTAFIELMEEAEAEKSLIRMLDDVLKLARVGALNMIPEKKEDKPL